MGNCWACVFRRNNARRRVVLILIGLDNAGKTKTVNNLAGEKDDKVLPTVGFKAVNLVHRDTPVTIYDLGGGPQFRQIWSQYYSEIHGVIFVIDSSDFSRLDECKQVLEEVLSHDKISGKPVLVLANKQDKHGALDDIDVVEKLNIEPLVNKCPTLVESYAASKHESDNKNPKLDPGLKKGYQWLLNYIESRYGDINLRVQTDIRSDLERRKRMLNKNINRASQTFTAVSDDITTLTGFANPNYQTLSQKSTPNKKDSEPTTDVGVIVVKPANHRPGSLDTTITIESLEDVYDSTSGRPKLSPLFGRVNDRTLVTDTVQVELEPRNHFRKLSPIVSRKSTMNHIDFKDRPQSSPTYKKGRSLEPQREVNSLNSSKEVETLAVAKRDGGGNGAMRKCTVLVDQMVLSQMHRELVLTERSEPVENKMASDVCVGGRGAGGAAGGGAGGVAGARGARPASASQLVRRQLELPHAAARRRLSLRYVRRNRTAPASPGAGAGARGWGAGGAGAGGARRAGGKAPARLGTGDCGADARATYLAAPADATL